MVACVADDSLNLLLIAMVTITMVYVLRGFAATQAINMAPGIRNSDCGGRFLTIERSQRAG